MDTIHWTAINLQVDTSRKSQIKAPSEEFKLVSCFSGDSTHTWWFEGTARAPWRTDQSGYEKVRLADFSKNTRSAAIFENNKKYR